jgi:hypothetical protein
MAEKYYSISPYAYCANNPIKYVDKDGRSYDFPLIGGSPADYQRMAASNYVNQTIIANSSTIQKNGVLAIASLTDVNDATVIGTTITRGSDAVNIDGTPAGGIGIGFAIAGAIIPVVSGSAVKGFFKSIGKALGIGGGKVGKTIGPAGDAGGTVLKQLPDAMQSNMKTTKNGQGTIFKDPANPTGNNVRVQQGNPNSPNPAQQNPYVKETRDGKVIDKNGNPTQSNSSESHISKDEYKYKR